LKVYFEILLQSNPFCENTNNTFVNDFFYKFIKSCLLGCYLGHSSVSVGFPLLPSARFPLVVHWLVHSCSAVGCWFDSPLGQFVAISPTVYVDRRLVAVDSCRRSTVSLSAIFLLLSAVV